jgi:predicted nuclease with TOPRIM domain
MPDARADAPAANAKPDSPPAPSASKVAGDGRAGFNDIRSHVQDLGGKIEGFRGKATGDMAVALEELEAKQEQLMAELERIGGENEKWDAARTEIVREAHYLRRQFRDFAARVNE